MVEPRCRCGDPAPVKTTTLSFSLYKTSTKEA